MIDANESDVEVDNDDFEETATKILEIPEEEGGWD